MTQLKYNTIFKDVKGRVSYEDLNNVVGWQSKRKGNRLWINSPFNSSDKNPSISLYAKAFKVKPIEAAQQLASMFHIPFKEGQPDRERYQKELEMKKLAKLLNKNVESFFHAIVNKYKLMVRTEGSFKRLGIPWENPYYRWIRQGVRFYDQVTTEFIEGDYAKRVRLMRNHKDEYFFKLAPGGGGFIEQ